ncbi:MAG TPA: rod shape-determining protein [Bacillota bacterium]|nr:rod shape-determining protein [Bacillota bacterium]
MKIPRLTEGSLRVLPSGAHSAAHRPEPPAFWERARASFGDSIGLDAGTANTNVYVQGRGIVLRQPSVIAIDRKDGAIVAVGREAKRMVGRTPQAITTVQPVRGGVVADFDGSRRMLRAFLLMLKGRRPWLRPRVVMTVPSSATVVERRAVQDLVDQVGGRLVKLVEEPLAAALGLGLPIEDASGCMVVNIGGGTTEVAVISLGGVVAQTSVRVAGDDMDHAIMDRLHHAHGLLVGQPTAEALKIGLASLCQGACGRMTVHGRDMVTGLPRELEVTASEVAEAIAAPLEQILMAVEATLSVTPPELAADVMEGGIMLTGGISQMPGLDQAIAARTRVPAIVCDEPLLAVARGVGRLVEEPGLRRRVQTARR